MDEEDFIFGFIFGVIMNGVFWALNVSPWGKDVWNYLFLILIIGLFGLSIWCKIKKSRVIKEAKETFRAVALEVTSHIPDDNERIKIYKWIEDISKNPKAKPSSINREIWNNYLKSLVIVLTSVNDLDSEQLQIQNQKQLLNIVQVIRSLYTSSGASV